MQTATTRNRSSFPRSVMTVSAFLLLSGLCVADELLRLVPDDAAVCLHLRQLSGGVERLRNTELVRRLSRSELTAEWLGSADFQRLTAIRTVLERTSGQPLEQSLRELLGEEVTLSVHFPEDGTTNSPQPLLLMRAADRPAIDRALATWSRLDRIERQELSWNGTAYWHVKNSAGQVSYYSTTGNTLVLCGSEALLKRVIEQHAADRDVDNKVGNQDGSLAALAPLQRTLARRTADELAALYINPRMWDGHVARDPNLPQPIAQAWQRCNWITISVRHADSLLLSVTADYSPDESAPWWRALMEDTPHPVSTAAIPEDAVFVASGIAATTAVPALVSAYQSAGQTLPEDFQKSQRVLTGLLMGLDPVRDVLPALGPQWLLCVVPGRVNPASQSATSPPSEAHVSDAAAEPADTHEAFPFDTFLAIELQSGPQPSAGAEPPAGDNTASAREAIDNALQTGLNLLAAVHNARQTRQLAEVHREIVGGHLLRWAGPITRFKPAYAISDRHLVLATDPAVCREFLHHDGSTSAADDVPEEPSVEASAGKPVRPILNGAATGASQFVFLNAEALRSLIAQHPQWFLNRAAGNAVPQDDARRRLRELDAILALVDALWCSVAVTENSVSVTLGASAWQP